MSEKATKPTPNLSKAEKPKLTTKKPSTALIENPLPVKTKPKLKKPVKLVTLRFGKDGANFSPTAKPCAILGYLERMKVKAPVTIKLNTEKTGTDFDLSTGLTPEIRQDIVKLLRSYRD